VLFVSSNQNLGNSTLSVFHLSTGHEGGAGLAARRLNAGLNQLGVQSTFLAISRASYKCEANERRLTRNLVQFVLSTLVLRINKRFSKKILFSSLSSNAKSFSYFYNLGKGTNTILHFHNWANLISEKNLLKLSKKGINLVLTTHDERAITGGCHYKFDCLEINMGCKECPLVQYWWQKKLIKYVKNRKDSKLKEMSNKPVLIAPSKWISREIQNTKIYDPKRIFQIPNTLGPDWNDSKFKYEFDPTKKRYLVGIAAMSLDSFVKAGDIISQITNSLQANENNFEFIFLKNINFEDGFHNFWSKIDVLLALSRADNSPNVIWEASSFGIPVISVNIGGIPEIISSKRIMLLNHPEEALHLFEKNGGHTVKEFLFESSKLEYEQMPIAPYNSDSIESHLNLYLRVLKQDFIGENK
jgi:glycosyltransferase involved in cell wall biosynthesis